MLQCVAAVRRIWYLHVARVLRVAVCCSMLQCDAVAKKHVISSRCAPLLCVAVCCSVLQCVRVCSSVLQFDVFSGWRRSPRWLHTWSARVCCSVLQYVAVRCIVLQQFFVCCSVLHYASCPEWRRTWAAACAAVCCSVLQCVAVRSV